MLAPLAELVQLLELEPLEVDLFRGASRDIGSPQVFGGQVLGQALAAAYATVEDRQVHSLHAYFLRRGDFNAPIVYQVDRSRDGGSFSSRRVVAIQHGQPILHMAASFQQPEAGLEHQLPMPQVPPPDDLPDLRDLLEEQGAELPPAMQRFAGRTAPFEFHAVQPLRYPDPEPGPPRLDVWFRAVDDVGADPRRHAALLAYVSDYHLIATAMRPHGLSLGSRGLVAASIDHAMWFHRPVRVDEWLLYSIESPAASGGRGFARASIYTQAGVLVASTAQEGLIRLTRPRSDPV
jgi:acyl-CoA thioesterase II